jgi:hypothetical protein
MLKDRIAELKAVRDQARADAERAEGALERLGPSITHRKLSKHSPGRLASVCEPRAAATAAITCARSLSASKWTRKKFASWGRKAYCCARLSSLRAQKRRVLACPVLYRTGALGEILTAPIALSKHASFPAAGDTRGRARGDRPLGGSIPSSLSTTPRPDPSLTSAIDRPNAGPRSACRCAHPCAAGRWPSHDRARQRAAARKRKTKTADTCEVSAVEF